MFNCTHTEEEISDPILNMHMLAQIELTWCRLACLSIRDLDTIV